MKEILLTHNQVTLIDDEDYQLISQYKWRAVYDKSDYKWRAVNTERINGKKRSLSMHRLIMNSPSHFVVDHINNDPLDNRRNNLRICTEQDNHRNYHVHKNTKNRYKGVRRQSTNTWGANIRIGNNQRLYLGSYKSPELAALAYNKAALYYHGEFAYLNKVAL